MLKETTKISTQNMFENQYII